MKKEMNLELEKGLNLKDILIGISIGTILILLIISIINKDTFSIIIAITILIIITIIAIILEKERKKHFRKIGIELSKKKAKKQ
ncbi:MAG: hypothetical protein ABIH59_00800 [archaeon]